MILRIIVSLIFSFFCFSFGLEEMSGGFITLVRCLLMGGAFYWLITTAAKLIDYKHGWDHPMLIATTSVISIFIGFILTLGVEDATWWSFMWRTCIASIVINFIILYYESIIEKIIMFIFAALIFCGGGAVIGFIVSGVEGASTGAGIGALVGILIMISGGGGSGGGISGTFIPD